MAVRNVFRTETIGVFSWFADSDPAPRVALARQDVLRAAFVSSRTEGIIDHVSFENVLCSADVPAA